MPDLTFIPAGEGGDHSSELVANHRIEELITTLSPHFDWIIIDSPPVLPVADAIDLARAADARAAGGPRRANALRCRAARSSRLRQLPPPRFRAECRQGSSAQRRLLLLWKAGSRQRIAWKKGLKGATDDQTLQCLLSDTDIGAAGLRSAARGRLIPDAPRPSWCKIRISPCSMKTDCLKLPASPRMTMLLTYYFDLYGPRRTSAGWEIYFRASARSQRPVLCSWPDWSFSSRIWTSAPMCSSPASPFLLFFSSSGAGPMSGFWPFPSFASASMSWAAAKEPAPWSNCCVKAAMPAWRSSDGRERASPMGRLDRFAAELRAFRQPRPQH